MQIKQFKCRPVPEDSKTPAWSQAARLYLQGSICQAAILSPWTPATRIKLPHTHPTHSDPIPKYGPYSLPQQTL